MYGGSDELEFSAEQAQYVQFTLGPLLDAVLTDVLSKTPDDPIQHIIQLLRDRDVKQISQPKVMTLNERNSELRRELATMSLEQAAVAEEATVTAGTEAGTRMKAERANPELAQKLGLKCAEEAPIEADLWRTFLTWMLEVIQFRLNGGGTDRELGVLRGLVPEDLQMDSAELTPDDLSDGKLLCAFALSLQPGKFPQPNPAAIGRIAQFTKFCGQSGVAATTVFDGADLYPAPPQRPENVLRCIQALVNEIHRRQDFFAWTGPAIPSALLPKSQKGTRKQG
jgi:hypothetical protein